MVEIRNPNIEIRNNLKIEMTQIQNNSSSQAAVGEYLGFGSHALTPLIIDE